MEEFAELMKQQKIMMEQQTEVLKKTLERLNTGQTGGQASVEKTMESLAKSMSEFCYDPENGVTFESWYARYSDWFEEDARHLDDPAKVRLLVRKLNSVAHARYANYILPMEPREKSFTETKDTLTQIFGRQTSLFNTRYNCLKLQKKNDDDFITYAGIVNKQCELFKLSSLTSDQFKCLVFICGLSTGIDSDIRTRLLSKLETDTAVTLQSLTTEANRLKTLKHDTKMIETQSSSSAVQWINKDSKPQQQTPSKPSRSCWLCGEMHFVRFCKYKTHKCKQCSSIGHKEGFCESSKPKSSSKPSTSNHKPQHHKHNNRKTNSLFLVSKVDYETRRKFATIVINEIPIRLQIDTASDISIISEESWQAIGRPALTETNHSARNASGDTFQLNSQLECKIEFNNTVTRGTCYISNANLDILGIDWIEKFGLWEVPINSVCNINQIVSGSSQLLPDSQPIVETLRQQFPEVFDSSLGLCTKTTAVLHLKPGAKPVFRPKRAVSYAALPSVEKELQRLEDLQIISKVDFSAWAAPIVVTKKANGSIRICADFSTGLNNVLESHNYPLPIPEDIFATLAGGRIFSKIDLADAYLQIKVDDASRQLLTINTHKGLYQYNRLCFGIKSAPGIFQQTMDTMLAGLAGTVSYLDDLIVVAKTEAEHKQNLANVLNRLKEWGFHVKTEKCELYLPQIKYLGFIVDKDGRRPDPDKIESIQKMPPPTDITTLRSFIGMINYYGQFVRQMREIRAPLDKLLMKDAKWLWSTECQRSFEKAKEILKSDLLLTHFDPQMEVKVAADASNYGLGAVILHRFPDTSEKAIAHAARALLPAEKNYSQIEKEALALIFAVTKFHRFLHGRKFTLSTDHKPLLAIFGSRKGIPAHTANRLQRWALTLLSYDFTIEHIGTTKFGHADALSRLMKQTPTNTEETVIATISMVDAEVHQVIAENVRQLPVTSAMIIKATADDKFLQLVSQYLRSSWPTQITDDNMKILYNRRESLAEAKGYILMSDRILIPFALQAAVLKQLHASHPGIIRMKSLARSHVYWPNIDKDIEDMVRKCQRCASVAKAPVKTTLSSWPLPTKPWARVHIDYAGPFESHNFLVIVDAFSKWPEIFIMGQTTTTATITKLEETFARFGFPEILVSDNGSQFTSSNFKDFCTARGIQHLRSPPYHPQSNGQAERFVDTFKRALTKAKGEDVTHSNLQTFLRCYRTNPNASLPNSASPSQQMFGRNIRTVLDLMHPQNSSVSQIQRNEAMELQYNKRHGSVKQTYLPGDDVYVMKYANNKRSWTPAVIIERQGTVIYKVRAGTDIWSRHSNQIRRRYDNADDTTSSSLPLDVLMDVFDVTPPVRDVTPPMATPLVQPDNSEAIVVSSDDNEVIPRRIRVAPRRLRPGHKGRRHPSF